MENSFNFECTYRDSRQIKLLNFDSEDGTQWRLTEEWLTSQRKSRDIIQRLIFIQENNGNWRYFINLEITCTNSSIVAGKLKMVVQSKPYMTKITIPLQQFNVFRFCVSRTMVQIGEKKKDVLDGVLENDFRYKVTISRAYVLKDSEDETPKPPNKLVIFSDQMLSLFESSNFSDAILTDGKSQLRVHRSILSARSKVFQSMFTHSMRENKDGVVYMPDTDFGILSEMVRFMYCGILRSIDVETAYELFISADKYDVSDLKNLCRDIIIRNIRNETVEYTALFVRDHPDEVLKHELIGFLLENFEDVRESGVLNAVMNLFPDLYGEIIAAHDALHGL